VGVAGVGEGAAALPKDHPCAGFFGYDRTLTLADVQPLLDASKATGTSFKMMVVETTDRVGPWVAGGPPTVRGVGFDPTFLAEQGATVVGMGAPVRGGDFDPTFLAEQGATVVGMGSPPGGAFGAAAALLVPGPPELSLFGPGSPSGGDFGAAAALLVPRPPEPSLIGPGLPFGGLHAGGMNVLWVDGSVRFVPDSMPPRLFRQQASLSNDPDVLATLP
jgi:prepilin-type processing-associated H-X9-DG protein